MRQHAMAAYEGVRKAIARFYRDDYNTVFHLSYDLRPNIEGLDGGGQRSVVS